jgi:hypothetical protein
MTTAKDIPSDYNSMHWETEYEMEQENNQMTNFLHLKINIGNNNLTGGIYHKAVETDTHILNTFQPFGRKQESHMQIHAKQNRKHTHNLSPAKKGSTPKGNTNSPQQ